MRAVILSVVFGLGVLADALYRDYPHLIIPLDAKAPDKAYGTVPTFHISNDNWTAANWDVPNNNATRCQLGFTINTDENRGAPWSLWGVNDDEAYLINIVALENDSIKPNTTFISLPKSGVTVATLAVKSSGDTNLTMVKELVCQKGQVASFLLQPADPLRQWDSGLSCVRLCQSVQTAGYRAMPCFSSSHTTVHIRHNVDRHNQGQRG
ncbi:uncharacterized protein CC84DRAFT_1174006 [Paraphaeosphaeria sporulosa]|uniref:Ubiquitin 3 binding protein But2 C-terminal domain-containing protein n=1 Tax=Paraphaeosphaeria sporulosa TaxID=1460663 RepID=A0A177CP44_9PLEO|nr:uncharacterized protein CC84DRAFT_1174006 [Paraphaeosphaeria sporulosa]OAG08547.1 hypothetical protein CC84DRAFT_1174006 [Paraphaeosphaeria sporulosa]